VDAWLGWATQSGLRLDPAAGSAPARQGKSHQDSRALARAAGRPEPSNCEGHVPNVVYTCGGMRHNQHIVLPYAVSDTFCTVATMEIAASIESLLG
jgi:hypothetical protein